MALPLSLALWMEIFFYGDEKDNSAVEKVDIATHLCSMQLRLAVAPLD